MYLINCARIRSIVIGIHHVAAAKVYCERERGGGRGLNEKLRFERNQSTDREREEVAGKGATQGGGARKRSERREVWEVRRHYLREKMERKK